jgi:SagB-type dehydrogenase family enzyme
MNDPRAQVLAYHEATKHHFHAYARGPGHMDWATQPEPFRRYRGAPTIELEKVPPHDQPLPERDPHPGQAEIAPLYYRTISQLLFDSLGISAWKRAGDVSWALRVNPSSGNLHPTEGYVICGPVDGMSDSPGVYHYAPKEHALELRAQFSLGVWRSLTAELPPRTILVGLTSIHWREAWKYGERAFRYCQHDVGHALTAISIAASGLGWRTTLLDDLGMEQLASLLGIFDPQGVEAEYPDCLLAVHPQDQTCATLLLPGDVVASFAKLKWRGDPNQLSPRRVDWRIIDDVARAAVKPQTDEVYGPQVPVERPSPPEAISPTQVSLRRIIRQRRSAVAMDGRTDISRDVFYRIMSQTLVRPGQVLFNTLPWSPRIDLALFVHRVQSVDLGLYILVRDPSRREALAAAMKAEFLWEKPEACPADLDLYRLAPGDTRALARQVSCHQAIASDGCFSLGMIADFERSLDEFGAWFYPRLFWECGAIGQVLYLAAEAAGVRGTGIGCFFDDPVHSVLGLDLGDYSHQSLYHFTMGGAVEDKRLMTLPAYPDA